MVEGLRLLVRIDTSSTNRYFDQLMQQEPLQKTSHVLLCGVLIDLKFSADAFGDLIFLREPITFQKRKDSRAYGIDAEHLTQAHMEQNGSVLALRAPHRSGNPVSRRCSRRRCLRRDWFHAGNCATR
jgi:hypothetical protein